MITTINQTPIPFEERVPLDETARPEEQLICSYDLFDFFTADIINEHKIFVR